MYTVQHQYTTCSFRVASVSTHKISYQKEVAMHVWIQNSPIVSCITVITLKIGISSSRAVIVGRPYTTFTYGVVHLSTHKME